MIDSTNPRVIADNIRHLVGASGSQASDISNLQTTVTALGNAIAALGTYSTTEVNTGMKYKGDDVYRIILEGNTPTTGNYDIPFAYNKILNLEGTMLAFDGVDYFDLIRYVTVVCIANNTIRLQASSNTDYQNIPFTLIIEYTKAAPSSLTSPAPDDSRSIENEDPEIRSEEIEPEVRDPEAEPDEIEEISEPVVETKTTRKKSTSTK